MSAERTEDRPRPTGEDTIAPLVEEVVLRRLRGENVRLESILGEHANAMLRAELEARVEAALGHASSSSHEADAKAPLPELREFAILMELHRDVTGVTYLANQVSLGRSVALKVLPEAVGGDEARLARFRGLARKLELLRHSAIASVLTSGDENGIVYYATDRIHGASLADTLQRLGSIAPQNRSAADFANALAEASQLEVEMRERTWVRAIARLFAELAEGLAYAHGKGVFHGDISPDNVFLTERARPKLLNFGVASLLETHGMSRGADYVGRAAYAAPEVIRSGITHASALSDIFSLGAILFESLTGFPPYRADTVPELLETMKRGAPDIQRALRGKAPRDLARICRKAMEPNPERRYATMDAFAQDLRAFLDSRPISAAPGGVFRGIWLVVRRHRWSTAALGVPLLAAFAFTLGFVTHKTIERVRAGSAARRAIEATSTGDLSTAQQYAAELRDLRRSFADRERDRVESRILLLRSSLAVGLARDVIDDVETCVDELVSVRARIDALRHAHRTGLASTEDAIELGQAIEKEAALRETFRDRRLEILGAIDAADRYAYKAGREDDDAIRSLHASAAGLSFAEAVSRHAFFEAEEHRRIAERYDDTGDVLRQLVGQAALKVRTRADENAWLFRYMPHRVVSPFASTDRLVPVPTSGSLLPRFEPRGPHAFLGDPCVTVTGTATIGSSEPVRLASGDLIFATPETASALGSDADSHSEDVVRALAAFLTSDPESRDSGPAVPIAIRRASGNGTTDERDIDLVVDVPRDAAPIVAEPTATPLHFDASARLTTGLDERLVDPGRYLLVVRSPIGEQRIVFEVARDSQPTIDVTSLAQPNDPPDGTAWIAPPIDPNGAGPMAKGFWIARRELTVSEWNLHAPEELEISVPGDPATATVSNVSFADVQEYLARRNRELEAAGASYRVDLPTQTEWTRAASPLPEPDTAPGFVPALSIVAPQSRRVAPTPPHFAHAAALVDESPFGVRGLRSGPSEWVRDLDPAQPGQRFYRGGALRTDRPTAFRIGEIDAAPAGVRLPWVGVRLVYRPVD